MTDPGTDFDREEAAFRSALAQHADDVDPAPFRTPRRHWRAPLLIAAVVLAVVGTTVGIAGTRGDKQDVPPATTGLEDAQWIGIRDIEVQAPADWAPKYEPGRPDCIDMATDDPADPARVEEGYVVIGVPERIVTTQGCFRRPAPGDPDPAFGELPFPLWRPYVKVVPARPDMAEGSADYRDGTWEFRGWRLTRKTYGGVQVSALSAPGDDGLGAAVMASARQVTANHLGCAVDSTVLDRPNLEAAPLPAPADVFGVVICDYVRYHPSGQGLAGSRAMPTDAARDLVEAILDAPAGSGPNSPQNCVHQTDRALVLRFLGRDGSAISQAYTYFDNCFENGIVTSGGTHRLTRDNCAPLFTDPPIGFFGGSQGVYQACRAAAPGSGELLSPEDLR